MVLNGVNRYITDNIDVLNFDAYLIKLLANRLLPVLYLFDVIVAIFRPTTAKISNAVSLT